MPDRYPHVFMANQPFDCERCGEPIKRGDRAAESQNGEIVHAICPENIIPDQLPHSIRSMKSQSLFKSDRDEWRIRVTEGRRAYNVARIAEAEANGAPFIKFRPVGDCCDWCKSLYEHQDGTPKLFALSAFKKGLAQTGGTNQGVPKARWSPYVEIAHPACRCRPEAVYHA